LKTKFLVIGLLPLFSILSDNFDNGERDFKLNLSYTPFIYFFYLIGGIMYGHISPAYQKTCFFEGFEQFYYIIAVVLGYLLMKFDKSIALFGGIILGMLAFSLVNIEKSLFYNLSMYFLQSAFGMIEIFIMIFVLSQSPVYKAISVIFSSMCLGILSGTFISLYLSNYIWIIATIGNIFLTISAGILIFIERRKKDEQKEKKEEIEKENIDKTIDYKIKLDNATNSDNNIYLKALKKRLSTKEYQVLILFLDRKTYKEIAEEIGISESTVKTYMKRIFEKEGVSGKKELLEKLGKKLDEQKN